LPPRSARVWSIAARWWHAAGNNVNIASAKTGRKFLSIISLKE